MAERGLVHPLFLRIVFNHAGPQGVTKQHFCKILGRRKLYLQGSL